MSRIKVFLNCHKYVILDLVKMKANEGRIIFVILWPPYLCPKELGHQYGCYRTGVLLFSKIYFRNETKNATMNNWDKTLLPTLAITR